MRQQDIRGVVVPFPRERVIKRRRVQPPPMKRIPIGAELRGFLNRMAERERR